MNTEKTWLFSDSPETTVLTLQPILEAGRTIVFVEHDERGKWRFFDARQLFDGAEMRLVPLKCLVELDPSVSELANLPIGWRAWREAEDGPWERESVKTKDRTRAKTARLLEQLRQTSLPLPPGSPTTTEMLREDRER